MKLHVIGEPDAVLGFLLVGLTGQVATTEEEVRKALSAAAQDPEVGVVFITERASALVEDLVDSLRVSGSGPAVVEIPGPEGPIEGRPSLHDVIVRATGVRM